MDKNELEINLRKALNELITRDAYLIQHDVHERTISSKLGCYLSSIIPPVSEGGWDVDVEYNRNGEVPKKLCPDGEYVNVIPDIIIHRRGENNPQRTECNNLLVIEIKKDSGDEERKADINKIQSFINESPFYYCFGAFVDFSCGHSNFSMEWFERQKS